MVDEWAQWAIDVVDTWPDDLSKAAATSGTLAPMAEKDSGDDSPSLEMPSLGFGRKRKRKREAPEEDAAAPGPADEPEPSPNPSPSPSLSLSSKPPRSLSLSRARLRRPSRRPSAPRCWNR